RRGGHRGRVAARAAGVRAVGAAADRRPRRGGRPAAPHRHRADGRPARAAGQPERPDAGLHQVPARSRGGRAGRAAGAGRSGGGRAAAAVLIARDDPLDTYLVRHPEILMRHPVEATVMDPDNPYVLRPHLCAAATELALTEQDLDIFGPAARTAVDELTRAGRLRRRPAGWFSLRRDAAAALGLRGAGLAPIRVVERATGRLVGTVDEPSA